MKRTLVSTALALSLSTGLAWGGPKEKLDQRIRDLGHRLARMQQDTEHRIPPESLAKAQGVILMERTKAGFLFAYQGGSGVVMIRGPKPNAWSPAAFVDASEASLGFQIGGQQSFVVTLLMTTNSFSALTGSNFEFGGAASGTAGDKSGAAEGTLTSNDESILVYVERKGLYGGAAVLGGSLSPDEKANQEYYGKPWTVREILFERKVPTTSAAEQLSKLIDELAQPAKK
jgi:SH3 domain-containing YSC84-like protein 1